MRICVSVVEWVIILAAYVMARDRESDTNIWMAGNAPNAVIPAFAVNIVFPLTRIYYIISPRKNHWPTAQTESILSMAWMQFVAWTLATEGLMHSHHLNY